MRAAGFDKPLTFLVIGVLVVALISSSSYTFFAFAVPKDSRFESAADCKGFATPSGEVSLTCCWREQVPGSVLGEVYCQKCKLNEDGTTGDCDPKELQMRPLPEGDLPQLETVPPDRTLPGGGIGGELPTLEQVPPEPPGLVEQQNLPELVPICLEGQELAEDTNLCVPTDCPEGQELNEETGICVLEEQPVEQQEQAAEEPGNEHQQTEEEQSSEESGSEEDNGNN